MILDFKAVLNHRTLCDDGNVLKSTVSNKVPLTTSGCRALELD